MEAAAYLRQVKRYDALIYAKKGELERLKALAYGLSGGAQDGERVKGGSTDPDLILSRVASVQEKEEELRGLVDYYVGLRAAALRKVESVDDPVHVAVLYRRYFEYQSWERIAVDLGYTYRHVIRKHNEALAALDRILRNMSHNVTSKSATL